MKSQLSIAAALILFATIIPGAEAQLLPRWFGSKTPDKNTKAPQADPRRVTEVDVEVAWLADPLTFPYYLEAHANGSQLEVRGYVPNKAVREHAIRIAQVYSTLPVVDSMKEHASLLVKPSQMSPKQLQSSAVSSLKVALPKQHQQLRVECRSDGKVYVVGTVASIEEKMAVSHSLRRLHGCTSVENLTTMPGDLAKGPPREKMPIVKTSNTSEKPIVAIDTKVKPWWSFGKTPTKTGEPMSVEPKKADGPILIPNAPEPKKESVKAANPAPLSAGALQKRIQTAFPKIKSVEVQFTSAQQVQITLELASESELKSTAERVFALPELENLRAELQFKITAP